MAELIKQNGPVNPTVDYLARADGRWLAVPATRRQPDQGAVLAHRSHEEARRHRRASRCIPPAARRRPRPGRSTPCSRPPRPARRRGFPFGIGLGTTEDNIDTSGAIFQSFGANLVDAKGNISVKTDSVRQALDYYKKLAQFLPPDAPAWDNTSNNKWLIAGKGALIMNPPSSWAVAKRDAPQIAEQLWTHGMPSGPNGRYAPFLPYFWGIWSFSKNKPAAKSLLVRLSQRASAEKMVAASAGYDLPAFAKLHRLQDLGRGRAAQGHALPLPESAQSSDPLGRRGAGAAAASPIRSIPRRSRPRWWCGSSRANRWKRPWPGPKARSKASCGPDCARDAAAARPTGRAARRRRARQRAPTAG